jgi:ATP synthase protein I
MPDEPPRPSRRATYQMGRGYEAAWEAALSVVLGAVLGIYADRWLGFSPLFLILFLALGLTVALRRLIRLGKQSAKGDDAAPR